MDIRIATSRIRNWDDFHDAFAEAFGFPEFYGRNMDAWIDCMSCAHDPSLGMTTVKPPKRGVIWIKFDEPDAAFRGRCPEIYEEYTVCLSIVNQRSEQAGLPPAVGHKHWAKR